MMALYKSFCLLGLPEPSTPFPHENKVGKAGNIIEKYREFTVMKKGDAEVKKAYFFMFSFVLITTLCMILFQF